MKKFIFLIGCIWITIDSIANNVVLSNISLITSGGAGNYTVQFDLSWANGWRVSTGQNNYDGVWIFFKYRVAGGDWKHLTMTGTNNAIPIHNFTVYQNTGTIKTGAIIHGTSNFQGTVNLTDVELGVSDIAGFGIDIRGYAIEMVFIPQCGNCIIGDGDGSIESINAFHITGNTSGAIGSVFGVDANSNDDASLESGLAITAAGIPGNAAFTTGQAFWSMKYEVSQGAYRDFLNSLNLAQQTIRTDNASSSLIGTEAFINGNLVGNYIHISTPSTQGAAAIYGLDAQGNNIFDEAADGEWVACNFLSWMDLAAYLDWAGLAPMSEIGFERICRGANPSASGEYAWGTTAIFASEYTITGESTAAELASNSSSILGNANYFSTTPFEINQFINVRVDDGPLRNGIFATGSSNRVTSGAAFYGVMEMSGNLSEPCVTVGNLAGRGFTSVNGNGVLSVNGNANTSNWPCGAIASNNPTCGEVTNSAGTILRGGGYRINSGQNITELRVSDRSGTGASSARTSTQGGRGVLYIQ